MINFDISSGVIASSQKVCVYGPEGIGKTLFASHFPNPLFIDTEGSTKKYPVRRLPEPTSWQMLNDEIDYVKNNPTICDSLIIDTFDWAEQHCINHVCSKAGKTGIEDFGYGNGYVYEKEEIARFLHKLDDLIALGINVVLTAHAHIKKFELPDETGSYDRWELKLGKKTGSQISPLIKEWCDTLIFANYQTMVIQTDKEGKKHKGQGGKRVMYLNHHPCWDAKNRDGLPDGMDFLYGNIANIILPREMIGKTVGEEQIYKNKAETIEKAYNSESSVEKPSVLDFVEEAPVPETVTAPKNEDESIPKALRDLMNASGVTEQDIRYTVSQAGYFPLDTPISSYGEEFINGALIGAWNDFIEHINALKKDLPFN